jgi:two-component system, sensor histidine kinase and response regulator
MNDITGMANSAPSDDTFTLRNVHTEEALARFAGDKGRYQHWLLEFIHHGPDAVAQIRQAFSDEAQEEAVRLAHALKGRTGMLGMVELHSICLSLEVALKNYEPAELWLKELECAVDEMCNEISATLGQESAR